MWRTSIFLWVVLGVALSPVAQAANIVVVTGTRDIDADGTQDDTKWVEWLEALGHTVDFQLDHWTTLDDEKVAALEAADLIILSRGSSSGNYNTDATEIAQWNAITTPILMINAYIARSSRWLWVDSTTINNLEGPMMKVEVPEHPVFTGVTLNASNQVAIVDDTTGTGQTSFIGSTDMGNGTLLASTGTSCWIAEWQPGIEFYDGSGQTAGGLRMIFCAGTQEVDATPQGAFNLTEEGEILFGNILMYMLGEDIEPGRASSPVPDDAVTDVARDVVLAWVAGENVTTQDVYFGTSFADVNAADRADPTDVLASQGQAEAAYDPDGLLDFSQTYYWRVDGFEADGVTMYRGDVWSFTTEPFTYPVENITATAFAAMAGSGPENTINGSGLNENGEHSTVVEDMWLGESDGTQSVWIQYEFDRTYKLHEMLVWNYNVMFESMLGFGLKDVTVEYSVDGAEWTVLADVEFAQATTLADYTANTTVAFDGVQAKYVKLTVNDNWGTLSQYGLSEVQFLYIPAHARLPEPADVQTEVSPDVVLNWRAGRGVATHEVYFGTDEQAVIDGSAAVGATAESRYEPGALNLGTAYYWRVDEVNDATAVARWEGDVWSFTTQEYLAVDDFEGYDNEESLIFETWIDGWTNGSGSTVGYLSEPFAERSIVHGGKQSMPLAYDNSIAPFYSEAQRDLGGADWTANGADTFAVYFQGIAPSDEEAGNDPAPLYVALEDGAGGVATVTYSDPEATVIGEWQIWQVPYSDLAGVNLSNVRMLYIGVGDRDNPSAGGVGTVYVDDVLVGHPLAE